ncbi:hypothetical protein EFK50_14055 [Nocardioides marmoriginsengisoli]|uniref:Uncharacterized protein n=1 Tax=Nocardioides marmoriginsengisoli TaxID=661483 RepID=A0A3N0CIT4_9ACTN|nr:hypothetical protein [Nocardioides marmoriginsengisoli]RNL62853.1 hypothetical protein EFK50_14055 [Nocardioides marmoriginsengisoli]
MILNQDATALQGDIDFDPTRFDGVWRLTKADSTILDEQSGAMVQDTLTDQWIERRMVGDVIHYKMHVQIAPDLTTHMGYEAKFNDKTWVPYTVVSIDGDENDQRLQPGAEKLLKAGTIVGKPIAWVKVLYVDPWTQIRISKNIDGTPQYVMQSRLSDDGNTLCGHVLTPSGKLLIDKAFQRESD